MKRDIPLLKEIAERTSQREHDHHDAGSRWPALLEPRAPRPDLRLKAVRGLREAGIPVGVFPNPIMPLITDQERRLDRLAKRRVITARRTFGGGLLFLMPCSRRVFFPFVEKHFPHLLRRYQERYDTAAYLKGPYRDSIGEELPRSATGTG